MKMSTILNRESTSLRGKACGRCYSGRSTWQSWMFNSVYKGLRRQITRLKIELRNWKKYMKFLKILSSLLVPQLLKIDFRMVSVSESFDLNVLYIEETISFIR